MKQSEVEEILVKIETAVDASHKAQVELLQAVRLLFIERQAIAKSRPPLRVDSDIELATLDEAAFDGLPNEAVFTLEEVAKLFRISRTTAYQLVRQGQIPTVHLGRMIRIPRRALVGFLRGMDADEFSELIKRKAEERYGA